MKKITCLLLFLVQTLVLFAQGAAKKEITLEDIWKKGTFSSRSVSGLNSMKDGKHYSSFFTDPKTNFTYVLEYEYASGKVTDTIINPADLKFNGTTLEIDEYQFSPDEQLILISTESEPIYRRSSKENNYIYNRKSKTLFPLSDKGKQQFATFSPDGKKIAFMRNNDLFMTELSGRRETQITTDGSWNHIINGGTDWVYEEEFEFARAFFWSPDGTKIAYYKFDESQVKQYAMAKYTDLYPEQYTYKYPKAGEQNAVVGISIYDLSRNSTVKVDVGPEQDQYIPRIKWTTDPSLLCVFRMNRLQNKLEYLLADAASGKTRELLTEESKTYVEVNDDLTFLTNGKSFLLTSEKDGYKHIYLYDMNGRLKKQLTKGKWEVTSLYGVDEAHKVIYYQSAETSPLRRQVYAIGLNGSGKKQLTTKEGSNDAVFSADYSNFITYHTDANTPLFITLNDRNGKQIRVLEDNTALREKLSGYTMSRKEFLTIPVENGVQLNAWMIKPPNFDPAKKYPVFMFVYGGPGSQTVTDSWGGGTGMWYQLLAAKGYIVVSVDNRGTGARGADFKKMTYLEMGKYETIDQIESAKWLAKQPYVDGSRIGIQGWSYGGYMSSLCITKGADVFKMAIAVAPVSNWRFYDSIYTERYLRTPQQNAKGYDENSPINFVELLKGPYLIIHGTADDNVHFQNSVEMVDALIKANKKFESAYYPDKNHSITGSTTRLHLYTKMTDFIMENL